MMLPLLAVCFLAGVEVRLAPDQPLNQVYVNEPLTLELRAATQTVAEGVVRLSKEGGDAEEVPITPVVLAPGEVHWRPLGLVSQDRGNYTAFITLNGVETAAEYCRVDRPVPGRKAPYYVHSSALTERLVLALEGLCITRVRLNAALPDLDEQLRAAVAANLRVVLAGGPAALLSDPKRTEALATQFRDTIVRWDIAPSDTTDAFAQAVELVRRSGARVPIGLCVRDADQARAALAGGASRFVSLLMLDSPESAGVSPEILRDVAEEAGFEMLPIYVRLDASQDGRSIQIRFLEALGAGARRAEIADSAVLNGGGPLSSEYAYLSALTARLDGAVYAGGFRRANGATALLFRWGAEWLLAYWSESGRVWLDIPCSEGSTFEGFDALNNPSPLPEAKAGAVRVEAESRPHFAAGTDYAVIATVAKDTVLAEAKHFIASAVFAQKLFPELNAVAGALAANKSRPSPRLDFFTVLRTFPAIEQQCHEGALAPSAAVPALASLGRLARAMCVLEQARGESFLEPFPETLAKCSDYKSRYLTGTGSGVGVIARGDWILQEVNRLVAEARTLAESGCIIEANAVATVAEWRARSLDAITEPALLGASNAGAAALPWRAGANTATPVELENEEEGYTP